MAVIVTEGLFFHSYLVNEIRGRGEYKVVHQAEFVIVYLAEDKVAVLVALGNLYRFHDQL